MALPLDSNSSNENDLKRRELAISEARLTQERDLKEMEIKVNRELKEKELEQSRGLKEKELDIQRTQLAAGRWTGPVAVAVVAGILGIAGSLFSSYEGKEIERKKQEGTVILEAIRTNATGKEREKQAAANLVFFADAGLVNLGAEQLKKLRERAGDASPSLPPAAGTAAQNGPIPDAIRQRILKSFDKFGQYFETLGLKSKPAVDVQTVPPDVPGALAYFDPAKRTVFIDGSSLSDETLPLREYAHAVLYTEDKWKTIEYDRTWVYLGVESALASYFSASFTGNPHIPTGAQDRGDTLDNSRKLTDLKPGSSAMWDGTLTWGAAFWDLRKALTPTVADKLLYHAWIAVGPSEIRNNEMVGFANQLLIADNRLEQGRHIAQIKAIFSNRGLVLP